MDIIQVLPNSVANQIAAGEVIQRPASIIKELVENAVDAGATRIQVLVVDAGKTSIQVVDNGCGLSITDARLAFERHATSKIRRTEDLFALSTMGFRGEALPSIAAVAQVTLTTRRENDELGTKVFISGSKITGQEPTACPVGANFLVENLFYNVPVRRRFLKSNTTELNNIITAFLRIALVYPEITFSLHSNGQELYNVKAQSLHQRILDIFGKKLNQELLQIDVTTTLCGIKGFVGKPESAHKKGVQQYFFVNGRFMRHSYFQKAVVSAYERLIPVGETVPYFIYFTMKPEDIDVNIHPTKTEIKFQDEQSVWQILAAAVKEAVGRFNDIPSIDFDTEGRPEIPIFDVGYTPKAPSSGINSSYNPFKMTSQPVASRVNIPEVDIPEDWEKLYEGLELGNIPSSHPTEQDLFSDSSSPTPSYTNTVENGSFTATHSPVSELPTDIPIEKSPSHYQYKGQYIMTSVTTGLMLIDQERAHMRILYEKYMKQMEEKTMPSQKILFPEMIQLTPSQKTVAPLLIPEMEAIGFEISNLDGGTYSINAVPAGLEGINIPRLVNDMAEGVILLNDSSGKGVKDTLREDVFSSIALSMARSAAIPYGQVLSNEEMENLVNELFACSNFNYTPDGKKILAVIDQSTIDDALN